MGTKIGLFLMAVADAIKRGSTFMTIAIRNFFTDLVAGARSYTPPPRRRGRRSNPGVRRAGLIMFGNWKRCLFSFIVFLAIYSRLFDPTLLERIAKYIVESTIMVVLPFVPILLVIVFLREFLRNVFRFGSGGKK